MGLAVWGILLEDIEMNYTEQIHDARWQRKRLEIMRRDNFKCLNCHEEKSLHVHHLHYEKGKMIWEYDDESLVTLCQRCHEMLHKDLAKLGGLIAFKALVGEFNLITK